ncbi:MAG: hypothetical protein WD512_03180, partial [Candidatus Paceibacterota bacterium]
FLNSLVREDPINIDRLNYLILDSNRSGAVEYGKIDVQRIIQNLLIVDHTITLYPKAQDAFVRFVEAYSHMYKSVYLHRISAGADTHLALCMKNAVEKNSFFKKLLNPTMDIILSLYDDVIIHELENTPFQGKEKKLFEDFLARKILTIAYETTGNELADTIDSIGNVDVFIQTIREKAKVPKNTIIVITMVDEKRAIKPPITMDMLKRMFPQSPDDSRSSNIDYNLLTSSILRSIRTHRVYTEKNEVIRKKIEKAVKSLLE